MTDRGDLFAALEPVASSLPGTGTSADGGALTWSRGGVAFAVLNDTTVELRIGATIAAAALRTPDVSASARGSEWVAFAPRELDGHALDRLEAWFGAAHRRAEPAASRG